MQPRRAGALLHPTSLPSPYGIGDLGPEAEGFVHWLQQAGLRIWQILPLAPPDRHASPYSGRSAFAGNPWLISPQLLVQDGLLRSEELTHLPLGPMDLERAMDLKLDLFRRAWRRLRQDANPDLVQEMEAFCAAPEQSWLEDWALFATLSEQHGGKPWWHWPEPLAQHRPEALAEVTRQAAEAIDFERCLQFFFNRQWRRLRHLCGQAGISLLGDLPIYVARDSAEVWARRDLFDLDEDGRPWAVAGVPPDAFSETGQLWGNPLYCWDLMAADGYCWWIERLAAVMRLVHSVRLDHFRGYQAFWRVPFGEQTAMGGHWQPGPGRALFSALREALGQVPLVAEDLGQITPDVDALRRELDLPGTRVLQFGFFESDSDHAVYNIPHTSVLYTGTHDNDTTAGWLAGLQPEGRQRVATLAGAAEAWDLIRLAFASRARDVVVPVQDLLGLGSDARMNTPGRAAGNWTWRLSPGALTPSLGERIQRLAEAAGRLD